MKTLVLGALLLISNNLFAKDKFLKRLVERSLIHVDKREPSKLLREPLALLDLDKDPRDPSSPKDPKEPEIAELTCDPTSVHEARILIQSCGQRPSDNSRPTHGGEQDSLARCVGQINGVLNARQRSGIEQDANQALKLCNQGIKIECVIPVKDFLSNRRSSTQDDDINEAITFCSGGRANQSCLVQAYANFSERIMTSKDRDINDSLSSCSR